MKLVIFNLCYYLEKSLITNYIALAMFGILLNGSCEVNISNCTFENNFNSYMYCVTSERNDSYWNNLQADQGGPYNGCIEIPDFEEFAHQLFIGLLTKDNGLTGHIELGEVFFESNEGVITEGTAKYTNPFRKPDNNLFKLQKEQRIIIMSNKHIITPHTIYVSPDYFNLIECMEESENLCEV